MREYGGVPVQKFLPGQSGYNCRGTKCPIRWGVKMYSKGGLWPRKEVVMRRFPGIDYDSYLKKKLEWFEGKGKQNGKKSKKI